VTVATITTQRLAISPLRAEDAAELFSYRSDPEVARYQLWRPASEADAIEFIVRTSASELGAPGAWSRVRP
jgi:RimJ/RimL family protein N-acetyltransferase